jgi:hypothetical protein
MIEDTRRVIDAAVAALGHKKSRLREKRRTADDMGHRLMDLEAEVASARREARGLAARVNEAEDDAYREGYRVVAAEVVTWARTQARHSRQAGPLVDRLLKWGEAHATGD